MLSNVKKGKQFTAKGYIVHLYGEYGVWIFLPSPDSSKGIWDIPNDQSFLVQDMPNDLFYTCLMDSKGIGTSKVVTFYDNFFHKDIKDTIEYFYCKLTVHPIDQPARIDTCAYIIKTNYKVKNLACWSLENYVMELEPLQQSERERYLYILKQKKRGLPTWYSNSSNMQH